MSYSHSVMSVVNAFNAYLGICLSIRLSFFHALKDMAACAKISVVNSLKLVCWLGDRSPLIFFQLFEVKIQPILNYGAEVWNLEADLNVTERAAEHQMLWCMVKLGGTDLCQFFL